MGKVVRFNPGGRFVVLQFPILVVPLKRKQLFLYRNELKVGEVRITGPQKGDHTVGDLLSGEAQPGDVARDR